LFADRLRRRFRQNLKRRRWNANSIRRSNFGRAATFLKLVAEAVAHGNHRLFHIMIEESRCVMVEKRKTNQRSQREWLCSWSKAKQMKKK
jgi:hypothetical protein